MLVDVGIDPGGIGFKVSALSRIHAGHHAFRNLTQAENALLAIILDVLRAENHGEIAGSEAPRHVHLPETVLRSDISLGKEEVAQVGSGDVRYAQRIVSDNYRSDESGQANGAISLRQRGAHRAIKPEIER